MTRANRHYLAGQVWHLTHRCHERQFLLRFARDWQTACRKGVEAALDQKHLGRLSQWTESLAVGSPEYVDHFQKQLGIRGQGREIRPADRGMPASRRGSCLSGPI